MSEQLDRIVERYVSTLLADYPVSATFLGVHDRDDELGEFEASALQQKLVHLKDILADLEALTVGPGSSPGGPGSDLGNEGEPAIGDAKRVDTTAVSGTADRVDAAALRAALRRSVFEVEELRLNERSPLRYVSTALSGCNQLVVGEFAPLEERARSLVGRLRQVPHVLQRMLENLVEPPAVFASAAADVSRGGAVFVGAVLPGITKEVPALAADLESAGADAAAAFTDAAEHLGELAEGSEIPFGVGRSAYEWLLREYHMLEIDSEELRETGLRTLNETRERMNEVAGEVDPTRPAHDVVEMIKADHPEASGLREHYRSEMARARAFVLENDLVSFPPEEELEVIDTPVFLRKLLPYAAYNPPGPFEPRQRGLFYVTPVDSSLSAEEQEKQLRGHSAHTIPIVALHEAYPGHHLQLTRSNLCRNKVRRVIWNNLFVEGWALYCEEMMKEAGFYTDARTRLCQLKETVWRAARVVVDVGLQLGEMSVDEGIDFMMREVSLERVNATAEVMRYTANPTQPSSYLVGKLAIMDIRRRYEERAGGSFSLKSFHDELMELGSIQPALVEASLGLRAT
jgi:hypothetical protein